MSPRVRPVSRRRVVAGMAVVIAALTGMAGLAESLSYPHPGTGAPTTAVHPGEDDPRLEIVCEDPLPREGVPRDGDEEPAPTLGVTSGELYDCPQTWDGRRVRYQGEVVGAVLRRDGGAWVQLNDDVYADLPGPPASRSYRGGNSGIGVFVPAHLADEIAFVGGPRTAGDLLEVTGRFHRVDPRSLEAAVIRADAGGVTRRGAPIEAPPLRDRELVAGMLALLALGAAFAERRAARTRRLGPTPRRES